MNGGWQWLRQPEHDNSSTVTDSVFDALQGGSRRLYSIVAYPDRQHALDALSAAVIADARHPQPVLLATSPASTASAPVA